MVSSFFSWPKTLMKVSSYWEIKKRLLQSNISPHSCQARFSSRWHGCFSSSRIFDLVMLVLSRENSLGEMRQGGESIKLVPFDLWQTDHFWALQLNVFITKTTYPSTGPSLMQPCLSLSLALPRWREEITHTKLFAFIVACKSWLQEKLHRLLVCIL